MRKDKNNKKRQETAIGKIIYGFLLFMPLLAIGFTCLYAVFNKNAYKSYYGETINEESLNVVSSSDNLRTSEKYKYTNSSYLTYINTGTLTFNISNVVNNFDSFNLESATKVSFYSNVYNNTQHMYIVFYNSSNSIIKNVDLVSNRVDFEFEVSTYSYTSTSNLNVFLNDLYIIEYNKYSFVSEVFYYSVDRVSESNLFNWAQNSIIYTTTSATCNALSITTPFIPLLMSYWLIISVIYFLYDIVLILIWALHDKIHSLKDNIV